MLVGVGGNNLIEGAVTRTVYLDFDTYELPGQHVYTQAERDAIQAQITADYSAFSYVFTQTQPQSGPYTTITFNDPALVGLEGGVSSEIDWRDLDIAGTTTLTADGLEVIPPDSGGVNVNNFLGAPGEPAATSADFIGLSATIAAHELGHLSGLTHADAYGPIGSGIYDGVNPDLYSPTYPGPTDAGESILHIMASGASVNATLEDAIDDPFFGERESIALSYGENGSPTNEQIAPHDSMADAQPLSLQPLVVPDTDLEGVYAGMVFDVTAADVVGYLGETDGASNTDFYSFTAQAGTLINFQLMSVLLTRSVAPAGTAPNGYNQGPFDTTLTIYNSSGQVIAYNDDSFQDSDSSIIDLILPTTGTYYAMVTSSPKSVSLGEPLTGDYELFMYTFAAGTTAAYPPTTPGLGDTMYAGSGDDTIIAGSADDMIAAQPQDTIVYGSGAATMLPAATSLNVSAGPNQMVNEGTSVTLTGSFFDPSGDSTSIDDWHVVASSGQQIADGTGPTFTFTPGNAGTFTVTLTVIDLNVGWDSADVVITSQDVPPVLTAPSASQSATAGVSTSVDLGTLAVTGIGPFTDTVEWGDGQTSTFSPSTSEPLSLAHTYATAGTYHDRRDRLRVRRWYGDRQLRDQRDGGTHVDDAHLVDALAGLRPVVDLHGHRDGPGCPDRHGGILRRPGHTGQPDRQRHTDLDERPVPGHVQHHGALGQQQPLCDHCGLWRRWRRRGQHIERRQRNDHQGQRGDRGHTVHCRRRRQPAHRNRHGHGRGDPEPGGLERALGPERHHPYERRYLHRHLDVRGQQQLQQRQRHNHRCHRPAPHSHRGRRDLDQPAHDSGFDNRCDVQRADRHQQPDGGRRDSDRQRQPGRGQRRLIHSRAGHDLDIPGRRSLSVYRPGGTYTLTVNAADIDDQYGIAGTGTAATSWTNTATTTATAVTPGTSSVSYGQSATFTATVSSSAGVPPDGLVQFLVNGIDYGSPVPLSGATAQLAISEPVGSYTIAAEYTGDASYAPTLPANETSATLTVNQAATDTSVAPGTATVSYGQSATFTATVSSSAGVPPDGLVQFLVNGIDYGSPVPLSGATVQLAISEPVGSYTIAAEYTGDASYAPTLPANETSATLTVNQAATDTSVAPGTATVSYGQSATFTATVSSSAGVPPDGSVQFLVNGIDYGSPVASSGATAQLAISEPVGSYTIAAEYTGDASYAPTLPANETSATLTVNQAATATSVTPGTATVSYGQSATFTATVSSSAGVPPDGSVQFLVNGIDYGSPVALSGATAQLAISEPVGSYTIAAEYTGDANYARNPAG